LAIMCVRTARACLHVWCTWRVGRKVGSGVGWVGSVGTKRRLGVGRKGLYVSMELWTARCGLAPCSRPRYTQTPDWHIASTTSRTNSSPARTPPMVLRALSSQACVPARTPSCSPSPSRSRVQLVCRTPSPSPKLPHPSQSAPCLMHAKQLQVCGHFLTHL
jgi:hypothetical protein